MSNTNRLIDETSPYLLQHAHNPVNWYPWGPESIQLARSENKPILLSIGYSACHWCHVMAHESFEDPTTAAVMNELFINIKVDREERPDLDKIYQTAHQLLTQRPGGWPLTLFLTPDQHLPFFAGTYFPPEARYGMPAFQDLMQKVADFYLEHGAEIDAQNQSLIKAMQSMERSTGIEEEVTLNRTPLTTARTQLAQQFEATHGGFGSAPKFPHPSTLDQLMRQWLVGNREDNQAGHMLIFSLRKMAQGGLFDHLGGGFCRYSTDDAWMIPHFEKMLYDNGPLLTLYSRAWQIDADPIFQRAALMTADWTLREMQSPEGGYYSSLDADSEGEEGKFYVWTPEQIRALVDAEDYAPFAQVYGLDRAANFEGKWHLHRYTQAPQDQLAAIQGVEKALFQAREQRTHPGRDDKILTSWNALMIRGMAVAGRVFNRPDLIDSAARSVDFIHDTLWRNGRLLATYKDGKAHLNAYLDDYAYLIDALLELLQSRWNSVWLEFARELAEVLLNQFEDQNTDAGGGFFFTSADHERLILRNKPYSDDAIPSGNGVAALALNRLGYLLGETRYLDASRRCVTSAWHALTQAPYVHNSLLIALDELLEAPEILILRGNEQGLQEWHSQLNRGFEPRRLIFAIPAAVPDLPEALAKKAPQESTVAYVCRGTQCLPPIMDLGELTAQGASD